MDLGKVGHNASGLTHNRSKLQKAFESISGSKKKKWLKCLILEWYLLNLISTSMRYTCFCIKKLSGLVTRLTDIANINACFSIYGKTVHILVSQN